MPSLDVELVPGSNLAQEAASLLSTAWPRPAFHYSPEYLGWQLSFPGPVLPPAAAAFSPAGLAGFAGSTHRRLRCGNATVNVLVVSFVAVHPEFRGRGLAGKLYAVLLTAIRESGLPVITYALRGSAGQRAIERAYPQAGFKLHSLGEFPVYGYVVRAGVEEAFRSNDSAWVRQAAAACAFSGNFLWSDPTPEQMEHYWKDPRSRTVVHTRDGCTAAWAITAEHATVRGLQHVSSLDCVWARRDNAAALPAVAVAAGGTPSVVVQTPSLSGFDTEQLRRNGFRKIAPSFDGYFAQSNDSLSHAAGTNLEVI